MGIAHENVIRRRGIWAFCFSSPPSPLPLRIQALGESLFYGAYELNMYSISACHVINKYNFKLLLVFLHLLLSYSLKFLPCVVYRPSLYYYLLLFFLFFTILEYYLGMKISQVENKVKWKMNYTKSIRIRYRIEDRQQ